MRVQAENILNSPPCGCKPQDVGYDAIAAGECCSRSAGSSGPKLKAHRDGADGDPERPQSCCTVTPLLDSDLDQTNPDVAPTCCA